MGGEAILPFHYVRQLRARGHDVHALTHARVRDEIRESRIWDQARTHFVEDSVAEISLFKASAKAPRALRDSVFGVALGAVTLARLAAAARRLSRRMAFDVIHQPTPVSPAFPSFLYGLHGSLVVGPMNGGMTFPKAFNKDYSDGGEWMIDAARLFAGAANLVVPGKRAAARILVANARTASVLPRVISRQRVELLVDNGVDLDLWTAARAEPDVPTFVFVGRLIRLKACDLLIEAFERVDPRARLVVIGDGEMASAYQSRARSGPAADRIQFLGFLPQPKIKEVLASATALVLPSLRECGGAVVLEAFACGIPAIASAWGGPLDYVTPETGILVPPTERQAFIAGLSDAMSALAADADRARTMGAAARAHVERHFTWEAKARRVEEIYLETVAERRRVEVAAA